MTSSVAGRRQPYGVVYRGVRLLVLVLRSTIHSGEMESQA